MCRAMTKIRADSRCDGAHVLAQQALQRLEMRAALCAIRCRRCGYSGLMREKNAFELRFGNFEGRGGEIQLRYPVGQTKRTTENN